MESIKGKNSRPLSAEELTHAAAKSERVLIDLGTGDGRFVLHAARSDPHLLAIGVDASRENLRDASRIAPMNAIFVISNVLALPCDLNSLAQRITINFPWGSLLAGLLSADAGLLHGLYTIARQGALLEVRLNASALAEQGCDLVSGGESVFHALQQAGFQGNHPTLLGAEALRAIPTTWAHRMAYGRSPEAVCLSARMKGKNLADRRHILYN